MFSRVLSEFKTRHVQSLLRINYGLSMSISNCLHSTAIISSDFQEHVNAALQRKPTSFTVRDLLQSGDHVDIESLIKNAQFLHNELPVRLSRHIHAIQQLPYVVGTNPHVASVYDLYCHSFNLISKFPLIETADNEVKFTRVLDNLISDHTQVVPTLSRGILECMAYLSKEDIANFFNFMIHSRIGMRVLAEQHISLHSSPRKYWRGIVNMHLNPSDTIRGCAKIAQDVCQTHYGSAPDFLLLGHTNAEFAYIPKHIEYIVFELLKNSMRAVVEKYAPNPLDSNVLHVPPIHITIAKGEHHVIMRISDQGGGIPYNILPSIWEYAFSTVKESDESPTKERESSFLYSLDAETQIGMGGPMAGLGFGLPMSRVYAEYFGGSIAVHSMHGYGTDVVVRLPHVIDVPETLMI